MELILTLGFVILFAVITYKMAESRGRNALGYTAGGLLVSPIVMWIVLAFLGKTEEQKVKELMELNKAMKDAEAVQSL